jgi:hypothetical protein
MWALFEISAIYTAILRKMRVPVPVKKNFLHSFILQSFLLDLQRRRSQSFKAKIQDAAFSTLT